MKKIIFALTACLAAGVASAEQWHFFNFGATHFDLLDMDSRVCDKKVCSAWVAMVPTDLSLPYDLEMLRLKVDCSDNKMQVPVFARYNKGKVVGKNENGTDWLYATPGSALEHTAKVICNPSSVEKDNRATGSRAIKDIREAAPKIQGVIAELTGKKR